MGDVFGYVVAAATLGGFGYFVYTLYQVKKERDTTRDTTGGDGGRDNGSNVVEH